MAKIKSSIPKESQTIGNLNQPELVAPTVASNPKPKIDGRKLRATGYTESFTTRFPGNFRERLAVLKEKICKETGENLTMAKVIVTAIGLLEKKYKIQ